MTLYTAYRLIHIGGFITGVLNTVSNIDNTPAAVGWAVAAIISLEHIVRDNTNTVVFDTKEK